MSERYEIKRRIGQGGVGAVYEAFDTLLNRSVAIKRLLPESESEVAEGGLGTDLSKEAAILSSLHHPNIISLYDISHDEEGPFVVMELIDGETIEDVVQRGAMTEEDFEVMVEQSLEALIAAQDKNLLHRDIKPTNIMVQWLGGGGFQIKVLDFGLAKYSMAPALQTVDHGGAILGSIYFLAPEQFERIPLDPRTDLYALGCVFYYCLTKNYPFSGESAPDVMMAHLEHQVDPLEEIRPDLPPALCAWVMRLLSREMDDRPKDARMALGEFRWIKANPGGGPVPVLASAAPPTAAATDAESRPKRSVGTTSGRLIMGDAAPNPDQVRRSLTSRSVATVPRKGDTTGFLRPSGAGSAGRTLTSRSVQVVADEGGGRRKVPTLAIALSCLALLAIIGVVIGVLANRDVAETDPAPPVDGGGGGEDKPVVLTEDGIPSEGLAAHYLGWRGVLKAEGVEAKSGDAVWGWRDQSPFLGGNLLQISGGVEAKGPTLTKYEKGKIGELKGPTPALHFSPGDALSILKPDALAIPKNWEGGMTVCLVVRSTDPENPRPLHFLSGVGADFVSTAELVSEKDYYAGGVRLEGGGSGFSKVKVGKNGICIITLVWDRPGENQRLFSRLPKGGRNIGPKIRRGGGPSSFDRWVVGGSGQGGKNRYGGDIFELAIYNRGLSGDEVSLLEDALAKRYYGSP